jgi:hypothetical protein
LTRDEHGGVKYFLPKEDCGPIANSSQIRVAERNGWRATPSGNVPPENYENGARADDKERWEKSEVEGQNYLRQGDLIGENVKYIPVSSYGLSYT